MNIHGEGLRSPLCAELTKHCSAAETAQGQEQSSPADRFHHSYSCLRVSNFAQKPPSRTPTLSNVRLVVARLVVPSASSTRAKKPIWGIAPTSMWSGTDPSGLVILFWQAVPFDWRNCSGAAYVLPTPATHIGRERPICSGKKRRKSIRWLAYPSTIFPPGPLTTRYARLATLKCGLCGLRRRPASKPANSVVSNAKSAGSQKSYRLQCVRPELQTSSRGAKPFSR